jgi:hypothetical protein
VSLGKHFAALEVKSGFFTECWRHCGSSKHQDAQCHAFISQKTWIFCNTDV